MILSKKQQAVMDMNLSRMTILEGAISSGKTFIGNHKSIKHLVNNYQSKGLVFFIGKTMDTLERNVLLPLEEAYGQRYFTYSKGAKKANLSGIPIELEGCNDIRAESKIRGTTAEFIYGDELTLWNKAFMTRCMGSLRTPNAKFLGTTNPDVPTNFIKTDWLDRQDELDLVNVQFKMQDNPSLTEEYMREVQKEYQGVFHDRFIKGLWVRAEGLVYPMFSKENVFQSMPQLTKPRYFVSVDYGTYNPFSAGLWAHSFADDTGYRMREYYYNGREENKDGGKLKTDEDYADEIENLTKGLIRNRITVIVDPSASSFIEVMRRRGFYVVKADNSIIDGIARVSTRLANRQLMIHSSCKASIDEFGAYSWDERKEEDKPIKENDHAMDEIRYYVNEVAQSGLSW